VGGRTRAGRPLRSGKRRSTLNAVQRHARPGQIAARIAIALATLAASLAGAEILTRWLIPQVPGQAEPVFRESARGYLGLAPDAAPGRDVGADARGASR
jgi:hypothetical protein